MKIVWSPSAKKRVLKIPEYISKDNPGAALSLIGDFERKVGKLSENPELGRSVEEVKNPNIRELIVHNNYGIIYEAGLETIEILTIRHFKQSK